MRRVVLTICLVASLLGGCNYIGFTGGGGGEFNTANFTVESGGRMKSDFIEPGVHDWILTSGFTVMSRSDAWEYVESTPEMGGFVKLGIEVIPDTGFYVNVLGGFTWIHWTSWYGEGTEHYGLYGGGITYFIDDKDACLLTGYDNRRGFTVGAGFRW